MDTKQEMGFSAVEAVIILVVLAVIGFAGWTVYHMHHTASTSATNSTQETTQTPSATLNKTYTDGTGSFNIKYPDTWSLSRSNTVSTPGSEKSKATLTSPTGTVLTLKADWGGRGGECIPASTDKPFRAGNACASQEFLSSEPVPSIRNVYYATQDTSSTYKQSTVVLTTMHYADPSGTSTYTIGLTNSNPSSPVAVNTPVMGFVSPDEWITVYNADGHFLPYVYAYASGSSPSFLNSPDAATVKAILKTLVLTD